MRKALLTSCYLLLTFSFLVPVDTSAQSKADSVSWLTINSNYDSVYVLINKSFDNAKKRGNAEQFSIPSGKYEIMVIPRYSKPVTISSKFLPDSFYVADIAFYSILREENELYSKAELKDTLLVTNIIAHESRASATSARVIVRSDQQKQAISTAESDYNSTYLRVTSNTDSLYLRIDDRYNKVKRIANGDSLLIKPGFRKIYVSHQHSKEWSTTKHFRAQSTTVINKEFDLNQATVSSLNNNIATKPYYDSNFLVVSDEDSKIRINGIEVDYGAAKLNLETGPVFIEIENHFTGTSRFYGEVRNLAGDKAVVVNAYTKPIYGVSAFLSILPGTSQLYKQQKSKAALLSGSFALFGALSISRNNVYKAELDEFNTLLELYNRTTNEEEAFVLGNQLERQQSITKKRDNQRLVLFGITGAIYAFNIYDALSSKPSGGYRKNTDLDFYLGSELIDNRNYSTLTLKYDF